MGAVKPRFLSTVRGPDFSIAKMMGTLKIKELTEEARASRETAPESETAVQLLSLERHWKRP